MRLSMARRWLMALLIALSAAVVAFDLMLRSSIDLSGQRSLAPLLRVRRARDLSFLQKPDAHLEPSSMIGRRHEKPTEPSAEEVETQRMEDALALTDSSVKRPQGARGLVLSLEEKDVALGLSLLLNLRSLGQDAAVIPVEIAHCGEDVPRTLRLAFASFFPLGPVRFHDVCAAASHPNSSLSFVRDDGDDGVRFRGVELRLAAVAFSAFDELLLLDAASLFFHDPTPLFDDAAYQTTGALFFPAARRAPGLNATSPSAGDPDHSAVRFDSSLAVWNKHSQRQATAALAVSLADGAASDSQEGSSEVLAVACERSGADFAVSRLDAGVVGSIVVHQQVKTTSDTIAAGSSIVSLCGALAQFAIPPAASLHRVRSTASTIEGDRRPRPLYLAGRGILDEIIGHQSGHLPSLIMYTAPATSGEERTLQHGAFSSGGDECAAIASPTAASSGASVAALSKYELERVALRRQQHQHVVDWARSVADWSVLEASLSSPNESTSPQDDDRLADVVRARVAALVASEEQLVYSLDQLAQRTSRERGIVLPLYDKIAVLGVSLVLELRELGVDLPVEIAHCGDLSPEFIRSFAALLNGRDDDGSGVRFYNVCALAVQERSALFPSRPLFCRDLAECHRKFRGFDIKVLALIFSQFAEVLLLDADTLFFSSPMALFDTQKYRTTGTLFFHDRISGEKFFMAQRLARDASQTVFHDYMLAADVSRFTAVPTLSRQLGVVVSPSENAVPPSPEVLLPDPMDLPFAPSDFLLSSHVWNARAGFEMDSSCVLWNKHRQPRATAVLASFIARNDVRAPPSYGDKELFFVACELAEARYAFSDFGIGAVGTHVVDYGPDRSVLCGDMSQNVPEWAPDGRSDHAPLLYINSDNILAFQPDQMTVFYSKPRPAEAYPGPFPWQQECPFNVTAVPFSQAERARVYRRQRLNSNALDWLAAARSVVW